VIRPTHHDKAELRGRAEYAEIMKTETGVDEYVHDIAPYVYGKDMHTLKEDQVFGEMEK
jgi:hypothetical protein